MVRARVRLWNQFPQTETIPRRPTIGDLDFHGFQGDNLTALRYNSEILETYIRLLSGAVFPQFISIDDNGATLTHRLYTGLS